MGEISTTVFKFMAKQKIKLNLGCGNDHREGFINIDAVKETDPDLLHDLLDPLPFLDETVSEILAQDILEHFIKEDLENLVAEIARVLKVGGKLFIRIPNIDDIIVRFENDKEVRNEFLYGTTKMTGIFGAHKVGMTANLIVGLMLEYGLDITKLEKQETNFWMEFEKVKTTPALKSITFINQTLGMGGAESFLTDLFLELNTKVKVKIYTTNKIWANQLKKQKLDATIIPVVIDIIGDWKGLVKAILLFPYALFIYFKIIFSTKSDLILLSGFPEKIMVSLLARLKNIPVVWIEFAPLVSVFVKFFQLPKFLYRLVKFVPEKVIVPTQSTKNLLIPQAQISLSKLEVLGCGRKIDPLEYAHIKIDPDLIVCVSRLEKGKGQDLLIEAMPKILKKIPTAKLKIVGEGDFSVELEKLINKYHLQKTVTLTGLVEDSLLEMAKASVCVFPSVWPLEGFGLVMIEAMALGKSVVGFDRTPTNEIIENNINGLLAKNGDISDLANQIIKAMMDCKLTMKIGKKAHSDYLSRYTIKAVADRYLIALNKGFINHLAKNKVKEFEGK